MMRTKLSMGFVVCVLVFAGCSSSDNNNAAPGLTQEKVGQVVQTAVGPVLTQVQGFLPTSKTVLGMEKGGTQCEPIDCQSGGTAEFCPDGFTFTNCDNGDGQIINGTATFVFDGSNGSITFNLTIGPSSLMGSITISDTGNCFQVGYTGFTTTIPGLSTTFDGSIEQCFGSFYPTGQFDVVVMDQGGNYLLQFTFNGTATVMVNATDTGVGTMLTCSANLDTLATTCN